MAHYQIGFATIDDPERMVEYIRRVEEIVSRAGGEFLLQGIYEETLEGTLEPSGRPASTGIVIRWPDMETIRRMYDSPEYVELRKFRGQFSTTTIGIVRDFDDIRELG
ncbi:DUF1330 domain-containing protein [Streptomyces sp. NPDC002143]